MEPTRRTVLATAVASGASVASGAVLTGAAAPAHAGGSSHRRFRTGAEVAAAQRWRVLRGSKVGIFSNPTGILRDTRHIVDDLAAQDGLNIVAAFGPEHGFRGSAQAGGSEGDTVDPRTQIPVYDAYGANTDKLVQLFSKAGLETVVFDIQDIGARFYTYIWTLYRAMAAAARLDLKVIVLDRPNPIGGAADGAMMTPGFTSGVGLKEIVQQHGMTIGELARFYNGEFLPAEVGKTAELEVVRVEGWRPDERAQDLGLPFVPPSPNIPTADSAAVYAGTCWFEGVNISEGRGTTRPFEMIGAPYLDYHWGDRLNERGLPGVEFREAYFVPTFNKYVNETCAGVQLHISDLHRFQPVPTAAAMLIEAKRYEAFQWRYDTYDPQRPYWIDKLSGSPRLRTMIDAGAELDEVVGAWEDEVRDFERQRRPYLLYRR